MVTCASQRPLSTALSDWTMRCVPCCARPASRCVWGDPMPWSVFDSVGRLLVRKGAMVQSRELLNRLVERGAFRSSGEVRPASQEADRQNSPFFVIGELMARLHTLLYSISTRRGDGGGAGGGGGGAAGRGGGARGAGATRA